MTMTKYCVALALLSAGPLGASAWLDSCDTFAKIYDDGKDLCETIFGDAFLYTPDEELAYSMWWFDNGNANTAVSELLFDEPVSNCTMQSKHKSGKPTPEPDSFSECHPWREASCCHEHNVESAESIKVLHGEQYKWDRCGPMSQACERFFVQEACMYECDFNIGNYRRHNDTEHPNYNWEIYHMPIKASYCDSWYTACAADYFCGGNSGSYFECGQDYWEQQAEIDANANAAALAEAAARDDDDDDKDEGFPMYGAIILGVAALLTTIGFVILVVKERNGKPVFAPLTVEESPLKESEMM